MKPQLHGAKVLVTGASSGIGREIARQLAPKVGGLILVARRVERLDALAAEIKAAHPNVETQVAPCDLSDRAAVAALIADLGTVDILVNNAGLGDIGLFDRQDWAKTERMLLVNINALTQLTRGLMGDMINRKRGAILNISSGFGLAWLPGASAYAGTKHYVTAFSEGLRIELRGTGVSVTQVCPGPVSTEFESVAGNPVGREVPKWIEIGPERCAAASIRGLANGRALVVPGLVMKVMMVAYSFMPRWLLRLALARVGPWLRRQPPVPN